MENNSNRNGSDYWTDSNAKKVEW